MLSISDTFNLISNGEDFYISLGNFLDEFYRSDTNQRILIIGTEPVDLNIPAYQKAFLAAAVHKLANDYNLKVPDWVFKSEYYSHDEPYFDCNARGNLRKLFLYKSPTEFKHRNIFVDENVLERV